MASQCKRMVETGKDISRWNATDIGALRCSPRFVVELDALTASGKLADVVRGVDAYTFDIAAIDPYVPKLRKTVASHGGSTLTA